MSLYDPRTLREAADGFQEFSRRFEQLAGERTRPVNSIVRFLRSIPSGDGPKKRELAEFFQTEEGQRYSREERFQAYNDLLGTRGNRESRG